MRGPIDYIIVGFEGNKFDGSILSELTQAIDQGVISLVALSLLTKNENGDVAALDVAQSNDEYVISFAQKYQGDSSLVTQDDIDEVGDLVENNTTVGLLVIEQLWAKPLKKALLEANGVLVAEGRIHPDAAAELNKEDN